MGRFSGIYQLFNGRLRYLFLVPVILMIGFVLFYQHALSEIEKKASFDKMVEKRMEIELISAAFNNNLAKENENRNGDQRSIDEMIYLLDGMEGGFAMRYDNKPSLVSKRAEPLESSFDPMQFNEFKTSITYNESGSLKLNYDNGRNSFPVYLSYKWVPSQIPDPKRSLLVIGVIADAGTEEQSILTAGIIVQTIITFLINMGCVILLCHLGIIYLSRSNPKWRAPL